MSNIFDKIAKETPEESKKFVEKSMDIVLTIHELLRKKGLSQKEFAKKMEKSESEISKWLCTGHNFTLKSIAKIEAVLGESVLIPAKFISEYQGVFKEIVKVPINTFATTSLKKYALKNGNPKILRP